MIAEVIGDGTSSLRKSIVIVGRTMSAAPICTTSGNSSTRTIDNTPTTSLDAEPREKGQHQQIRHAR
jgi:hypothetical protein